MSTAVWLSGFLRAKFICIIWTKLDYTTKRESSWGLSLFVLFEPATRNPAVPHGSWGLSLFVLFEPENFVDVPKGVLEG